MGNGVFDGEKVPVVKYSFLISEKTLVRKAAMKRLEGNEMKHSCADLVLRGRRSRLGPLCGQLKQLLS